MDYYEGCYGCKCLAERITKLEKQLAAAQREAAHMASTQCSDPIDGSREFDSLQRQVVELTAALERWHQIHDAIVDVLEGRPVTDDHTLVVSIKGLAEKLWKDVEKGDDLDRTD